MAPTSLIRDYGVPIPCARELFSRPFDLIIYDLSRFLKGFGCC
jgi:hypothetical protein